MAIVIVNIMTGLLQVITIAVISRINSAKSGQMITGVIVMQAIELLVFSQWGYALNEFIKGLKIRSLFTNVRFERNLRKSARSASSAF
ncbi:hypothetical protein HYN59_07415 [Flavobacterium album]|uniref:Uncharacterized protein n=1 Tax=Flavobacterium album TaxID=2175091 RepID=A0A2S1QX46_9FLAO|nr:hypothetical protein HYN59_07415 [Flavobacterium album]